MLKAHEKTRWNDELTKKWDYFSARSIPKVYDSHVITAEFLINNIEQSFLVWKNCTWNNYYSFDEFCEYILPYRIKDEPLEEWRTLYFNKYKPVLDSLYQGEDVIEAAKAVVNYLKNEHFVFTNIQKGERFNMGASYLFANRAGTCREASDIAIYTMRSLGIPIASDEYIISPSYGGGRHFWTAIPDTNKMTVPFLYYEYEFSRTAFDTRKKGKIYRMFFGMQPEEYKGLYKDKSVPARFRNPFYKDVSEAYFSNECRVEIIENKQRFVYLSAFGVDRWQPVDVTTAEKIQSGCLNIKNTDTSFMQRLKIKQSNWQNCNVIKKITIANL